MSSPFYFYSVVSMGHVYYIRKCIVREWVSISISQSIRFALEAGQMLHYDFLRLKLFRLSTVIYVYITVYVL